MFIGYQKAHFKCGYKASLESREKSVRTNLLKKKKCENKLTLNPFLWSKRINFDKFLKAANLF